MSKEYTYIDDVENLVGKTIQRTVLRGMNMFLIFEDKTWTAVESRIEEYEDYPDIPRLVPKGSINHELEFAAGILSKGEYDESVKQFMKNQKRARDRQDKQTYEMLKAKFEK